MSRQTPQSLMLGVIDLVREINLVGLRLTRDEEAVFGRISLQIGDFIPSELGFLRAVSWLYVLFYEAGRVDVEFLQRQLVAYGLDNDGKQREHLKIVREMRTFLQHNLDPTKEQNRLIQIDCEHWLQQHCHTRVPTKDSHWKNCLVGLLWEAVEFLTALRNCIYLIEQDESCEDILNQWLLNRRRYHPPHEFEMLISLTAADMGRDSIDSGRLCKRYYEKWSRELNLLQGNYDFKTEGRKLIEHVLLVETTPVLPITGDDIIRKFNIPSGPQVGELLRKARLLYDTEPCPQDALLEKLSELLNEN